MSLTTSISDGFAKVSARERRLLAVVALIALVLAPLKASEMRTEAITANDEARATLQAAQAAARRASGQGVSGQIARTRADVREWSWPAPSVAVGQVMAQNELSSMAAKGGLSGAEVRATGKPEAAGSVALVGVEVVAPFSWSGLSGFLNGLQGSGKGFILESVMMTDDKEPKARILVRLPIVVAEIERI